MKWLLVLAIIASVALADDKTGHLHGGDSTNNQKVAPAAPAPAAPVSTTPAVPGVAPSAPAKPIAPATVETKETTAAKSSQFVAPAIEMVDEQSAAPEPVIVVDAEEASPEVVAAAAEPVLVIEVSDDGTETTPTPSTLLPSFFSSLFGANPSARQMHRPRSFPQPQVFSADATDAADVIAAGQPGLFSSIASSIMDTIFGSSPASLPPPPPPESFLSSKPGLFGRHPFFASLLGPRPDERMSAASAFPAMPELQPDGITTTTVFTVGDGENEDSTVTISTASDDDQPETTDSSDDSSDDAGSEMTIPGGPRSMHGGHRHGGMSRIGKFFNRCMRFLGLRPHPHHRHGGGGGRHWWRHHRNEDASDDDAQEKSDSDDEDSTTDNDNTNINTDDSADADADEEDGDKQSRFGAWRNWGLPHRWGRRHHRACKHDLMKFCARERMRGGFIGAVKCMIAHRSQLSAQCLAHIQNSRAFNCAPDAVELCPEATTRHALKRCLRMNKESLSAQCLTAMNRHHPMEAVVSVAAAPEPTPAPTPAPPTPTVIPVPERAGPEIELSAVELASLKALPARTGPAQKPAKPSAWQIFLSAPKWLLAVCGVAMIAFTAAGIAGCVMCARSRASAAVKATGLKQSLIVSPAARSAHPRVEIATLGGSKPPAPAPAPAVVVAPVPVPVSAAPAVTEAVPAKVVDEPKITVTVAAV